MKLRFAQIHYRNTAISCNGHRYVTDSDGCIEVEDIEDIKKFLQNPKCERVVQRTLQVEPVSEEVATESDTDFPPVDNGGIADSESLPSLSMSLYSLKNMADELGVDYSDKPKKQELYDRLMAFIKG